VLPPSFEEALQEQAAEVAKMDNDSWEQDIPKWMFEWSADPDADPYELPKVGKLVSDIRDYLEDFYHQFGVYNTLSANCQRFAYELYKYLVFDGYSDRVEALKPLMQSPMDKVHENKNAVKKSVQLGKIAEDHDDEKQS